MQSKASSKFVLEGEFEVRAAVSSARWAGYQPVPGIVAELPITINSESSRVDAGRVFFNGVVASGVKLVRALSQLYEHIDSNGAGSAYHSPNASVSSVNRQECRSLSTRPSFHSASEDRRHPRTEEGFS